MIIKTNFISKTPKLVKEMEYNFLKNPSDDFICTICSSIFKECVEINECKHTFCKECIKNWFLKSKTCPICNKLILNVNNLNDVNFVNQYIKKLAIKCSNSLLGILLFKK
jgi:hypothetical protein